MSHIVIGRPAQEKGPIKSAEALAEFNRSLLMVPEPQVEEALENRLVVSAEALIYAAVNKWPLRLKDHAIKQHITSAHAVEQYCVHVKDKDEGDLQIGVNWRWIAQTSLDVAYARTGHEEHGGSFLNRSNEKARKYSRATLAALEPAGMYTAYTFAAGVAMGKIQPALPDFGNYSDPYKLLNSK